MFITDASNLTRLINCNGSRLLVADPITAERDTTIREEGNAAHWLASVVFAGKHTVEEMIDSKAPNGVFITPEMGEHVSEYISTIDRNPRSRGTMEWSHSFGGQGWQVNGRADFINHVDGLLNVDDFKYGYTIVEPQKNWTLIAHAIGYCVSLNVQPQWITFTIHQPRAPHREGRTRHVTISYAELCEHYAYINSVLSNPSSILQTGPHCYKCPSFLNCVARQDADLSAIEVAHMAYSAGIDDIDLAARMQLIERAGDMLKQAKKAYEEEALYRVKNGRVIKGYGIEDGFGNRAWLDGVTPQLLETLSGKPNLAKKQEPVSPRQAELAGVNESIVAAMSYKPKLGAKIVKINANKKAEKLFGKK